MAYQSRAPKIPEPGTLDALMSTTIPAFPKMGESSASTRRTLIVERHGSLHADDLRGIVRGLGFDVALEPIAGRRLQQRDYGRSGLGETER